jgi:signal peptidase
MWFRPGLLGGSTHYILVSGHSMEPTLWTGDLAILRKQETYGKGDIVAFQVENGGVVIHRIVGGDAKKGYVPRGDNRDTVDFWRPKPANIGGKMWFHIPKIGIAVTMMRAPQNLPVVAALAGFLAVLTGGGGKNRRAPPRLWLSAPTALSRRYFIPFGHPLRDVRPVELVPPPRGFSAGGRETTHAHVYDLKARRRWGL